MPNPTQFPWPGMAIVIVAVLGLFLMIALTLKVAEWAISAREELRDRYASTRWKPVPIDVVALPLWIALELLCFVAGIAYTLLAVFVAYQTAKGVRDWWHAGNGGHGR